MRVAACNETGSRRLLAMMREYDLESLDELGAHIIDTSRVGMEKAINDMPKRVLDPLHAYRRVRIAD